MSILSSQIDELHEAERGEFEAARLLSEWRITVRRLQQDLEKGACLDNHWQLSLRRAKAQCARAEQGYTIAANKLSQLHATVAVAETVDASFDESERTYVGPPLVGEES